MQLSELIATHIEKRREWVELREASEPSETRINAVDAELRNIEKQIAQYDKAHDAPDPEPEPDTNLYGLISQCDIGRIVDATIAQRSVDGAEAELQQEANLHPNQIPLELLYETRAVTPAPSANIGVNQSEILPILFPNSAANFLGVPRPTVPVGTRAFPILTTGATVHQPAKNASAAETTGAFSSQTLTPKRLQASFFYAREDANTFAGMGEALRRNLNEALSDQLDNLIIGALIAHTASQHEQANLVTYASGLQQLFAGVDGTFASRSVDVSLLCSPDFYRLLPTLTNADVSDNLLDAYERYAGGLQVSPHLPALASKKRRQLFRVGSALGAIAPIWQGITLIPDEITKASTGEIVITALMLYNFAVLRAQAYRSVEFQLLA